VLTYLPLEDVAKLADDVHAQAAIESWIVDFSAPFLNRAVRARGVKFKNAPVRDGARDPGRVLRGPRLALDRAPPPRRRGREDRAPGPVADLVPPHPGAAAAPRARGLAHDVRLRAARARLKPQRLHTFNPPRVEDVEDAGLQSAVMLSQCARGLYWLQMPPCHA